MVKLKFWEKEEKEEKDSEEKVEDSKAEEIKKKMKEIKDLFEKEKKEDIFKKEPEIKEKIETLIKEKAEEAKFEEKPLEEKVEKIEKPEIEIKPKKIKKVKKIIKRKPKEKVKKIKVKIKKPRSEKKRESIKIKQEIEQITPEQLVKQLITKQSIKQQKLIKKAIPEIEQTISDQLTLQSNNLIDQVKQVIPQSISDQSTKQSEEISQHIKGVIEQSISDQSTKQSELISKQIIPVIEQNKPGFFSRLFGGKEKENVDKKVVPDGKSLKTGSSTVELNQKFDKLSTAVGQCFIALDKKIDTYKDNIVVIQDSMIKQIDQQEALKAQLESYENKILRMLRNIRFEIETEIHATKDGETKKRLSKTVEKIGDSLILSLIKEKGPIETKALEEEVIRKKICSRATLFRKLRTLREKGHVIKEEREGTSFYSISTEDENKEESHEISEDSET